MNERQQKLAAKEKHAFSSSEIQNVKIMVTKARETRERTSAWYIFLRGAYVSVHFFPNLPGAFHMIFSPK
jgi:hypothetical protein